MANSHNSNPIVLDTDISTGWRANQTLNVGNLPSNAQQLSGPVTRQWGIRVSKIVVEAASGAQTAGVISIVDPNDNTVLWSVGVPTGTAVAGTVLAREDFADHFANWRDFKVTGLTATASKIYIWYRA